MSNNMICVIANRLRIRKQFLWLTFIMLCALGLLTNAAQGQPSVRITTGTIGANTDWATEWYATESGKPGPTVLVLGGIHGNEPAGYRAAEQIRHWPVATGKLIVIPRVNRLGLQANMRWLPEFRNDRPQRDLNRNFPTKNRDSAQTEIAQAIWEYVQRQKPDWVFDLHEGFDFHRLNSKSVGSSVIAFPEDSVFAQLLVDRVNVEINPDRQFDLLAASGPVNGSLARACHRELGSRSFIVETTFKEQPISTRTRQHRRILSTAFQRIGLTEKDCSDFLMPVDRHSSIAVAVFDGPGASESGVVKVVDRNADIIACQIGPAEMRMDILKQFDVVIFPGGSGGKQGKAIGENGRNEIRQFVHDGGGLVGICAGAYLCSSQYTWSLDLMNTSVFNTMVEVPGKGRKSMWYRGGKADVEVEITEEGSSIFGLSGRHTIRYQNGPIISPGESSDSPKYEVLAFFRSENGIYEAQKGTMIDTPAVVTSIYGEGRVLAISPHFESTSGKEDAIIKGIEYVARSKK